MEVTEEEAKVLDWIKKKGGLREVIWDALLWGTYESSYTCQRAYEEYLEVNNPPEN